MSCNKHKIQDKVYEQGQRWTPAREAVLGVFEQVKRPLTVSEIHKKLRNSGIDLASVYRTINLFCSYNILHYEDTVAEGKRYELSEPYEHRHHHHLVCESCGKVEDYYSCEMKKMEKKIAQKTRFEIRRHDLKFLGICRDCRKA